MNLSELQFILGLSALAQAIAAWIALRQMADVTGRYRLAWGCVSLALALMVQRRAAPWWRSITEEASFNTADALFGLAISLFMVVGIWGIRRLFIDMRQQDAALEILARTDALTELPNRRETLERVRHEFERSARSRQPLSLLMFDIDHFKEVNDRYGHGVGDIVLQGIATVARNSLRRIDVCGRIGGEEFLVLLPESDREEALAAAERLRGAIAGYPITADGHVLKVTVSVGVITHTAPASPGIDDTPEILLRQVDQALYEAKANGRNRIAVA